MLLLALFLLSARDELYSTDSLGLDTLPPPGYVNLVTAKRTYFANSYPSQTESTFVERGSGTGRRTTTYWDGAISGQRSWMLVEEGITNGLVRPDLTIETRWWSGTEYESYRARREMLPDGNRWIHDTIPGVPYMAWGPETLLIRTDEHGRETERRESWYKGSISTTTEWGPFGPTRESHFESGILTKQITTSWQDGIRVHQTETNVCGFTIGADSLVRLGDTLEVIHCGTQTGSTRNRLDSLGRIIASWRVGASNDTTRRIYDQAGRLHQIIRGNGYFTEQWNWDAGGNLSSVSETRLALEYHEPGNPRTITMDSIEWKDHRIQRRLYVDCFATDSSRKCQDQFVDSYTYATLEATPTRIAISKSASPLRIIRTEHSIRWIGSMPDGTSVRIHSLDGRAIGSAIFKNGHAEIASPRNTGVFLWTIDGDGLETLTGSMMP